MARIPQQLQPPSKPLTVAETRAARRPVQRAVQRPLTQQQIQQQEELVKRKQAVVEVEKNISQWTQYLREREAEEKYLTEVAGKERNVGTEMRGVLERKRTAYQHLDQLKRAKVAAEAGVLGASQVGTYVRQTLEKEQRQSVRIERATEFQKEVKKVKGQIQSGGSGEFTYDEQDYVIEGGQVYQVSTTESTVVQPPPKTPTYETVVTGTDAFGRPVYSTVRSDLVTPKQKLRTKTSPTPTISQVDPRELAKKKLIKVAGTESTVFEKRGYVEPAYKQIEVEPDPTLTGTAGRYVKEQNYFDFERDITRGAPIGIGGFPISLRKKETVEKAIELTEPLSKITDDLAGVTPEREGGELFMQVPSVGTISRRESITYTSPKLTEAERVSKETIMGTAIAGTKAEMMLEEDHNKIIKRYEDKVYKAIEKGDMNEKELLKFIENQEKQLGKELGKSSKKIYDKYGEEISKFQIEQDVKYKEAKFKEDLLGKSIGGVAVGLLYATPFVGQAFLAADLIRLPGETAEAVELGIKHPSLVPSMLLSTGVSMAGMVAGGATVGVIKGKIEAGKIDAAIKNMEFEIRSAGKLTESRLKSFGLDAKKKLEIKQLMDEGHSIKILEVVEKAAKGHEQHTPKIEGKYIEVTNRQGDVVFKKAVGKLKAELNGKTITKAQLIEAVYLIERETGKIEGYSDVLDVPMGKFKMGRGGEGFYFSEFRHEKAKLSKFKEKGEIISREKIEGKNAEVIEMEITSELLGVEKYKGQDMVFNRYKKMQLEPFSEVSGKPFGKAKFKEVIIKTDRRVDIFGDGKGFIIESDGALSFGAGRAKRVDTIWRYPKAPKDGVTGGNIKPLKVSKDFIWNYPEASEPKFKFKKPKSFKAKSGESSAPSQPSYVGEYGGVNSMGAYSMMGSAEAPMINIPPGSSLGSAIKFGIGEFAMVGFKAEVKAGLGKGVGRGAVSSFQSTPIEAEKREGVIQSMSVLSSDLDKSKLDNTPSTILISNSSFKQPVKDFQDVAPSLALFQAQKSPQVVKQKLSSKLSSLSIQRSGLSTPTITPPVIKPPTPIRLIFDVTFPGETYNKEDQTGYHAYVKEKGKYIKVSNKPMTRQGAKSIGARYVDNTVSATFRIEPIKETRTVRGKKVDQVKVFKEDELQKGSGYFNKASNKFRDYMVRKGNQVQMNNKWIERQGKRADTSGEQKGLTVAKYRATVQKKRAGVPTRKSKGRNVKSFFGM